MKFKLGFMLGALMITLTGCNGKISCDDPEIASGILATIAEKMEDTKNKEKLAADELKHMFRGGDKINIGNLVVETQEVDETDANKAEPEFFNAKRLYLQTSDMLKLAMEQSGVEYKTQICSYRIKDTISNKYVISYHDHQWLFYKYTDDDRWRFGGLSYMDQLGRWALAAE